MDGQIVIGTKLDTKRFDLEINATKQKLDGLVEEYKILKNSKPFEGQEKGLLELQKEIEKTRNKLVDLKTKQDNLNKSELSQMPSTIQNIGNGMESIIKKVAKWSLGVIGIRTVYLGIRQAMSALSQYDDKLQANIEYIRFALANSLKPIIEWIIKAMYIVLGLVGRFFIWLTGKNIFKNSGIDDFQKSLKTSNKNAKELKKTLAGFDEMNVLNADGSTGSSGGGAIGNVTPDFDFSNMDKQIDGWIKKVKNKWENLGKDMAYYLAQPSLFDKAFGVWGKFVYGVVEIFFGIYNVIDGLVDQVVGIFKIIKGIFTGNTELIKEGLKQFIQGAKNILTGIIFIVQGIKDTIFGLIKGLILTILDWAKTFITNVGLTLKAGFTDIWIAIKNSAKATYNSITSVFSKLGNVIYNAFSSAWTKIKKLFSAGGKIFDGMKDGIVNAFKSIVNALISGINKAIAIPFNKINNLLNKIRKIEILKIKPFKSLWGENPIAVPQIPKLAKGGIVNLPGKGVPVGGAITGEQRQEGVIPLTDSQQMSLLGEAIGRYITVNLTNITELDGRTIARKVQEVNSNTNFLMNR